MNIVKTATLQTRVSEQTQKAFHAKVAKEYPGIAPASVLRSLIEQFLNQKGTTK
jgi:hypothetical protein